MVTIARAYLLVLALVCESHAQVGRSPLFLPPMFPFGLKPGFPLLFKPPIPFPFPVPAPFPIPFPIKPIGAQPFPVKPTKPLLINQVRYSPMAVGIPVQSTSFQDPYQVGQGQFMTQGVSSDQAGFNTFNFPVQAQMADIQQFRAQQPGSQQMATRLQVTVPVAGGSPQSFQQFSRSQGVSSGTSDNDAQISLRGPTQVLLPANIRILPVSADQFSSNQGQPQQFGRSASSLSSQGQTQQFAQPQFQQNFPAVRAPDCQSGATLDDVQIANSPCVPASSDGVRQVAFAGSVPNDAIYSIPSTVVQVESQDTSRSAPSLPSSQGQTQQFSQPQVQQNVRASDCSSGATVEDVQVANSPCTPVMGVPQPSGGLRQAAFAGVVPNIPISNPSPVEQIQSQDVLPQTGFSFDSQDMIQSGVASGERTMQVRLRIPLPADNSVQETQIPVEAERSNLADADFSSFSAVLKHR